MSLNRNLIIMAVLLISTVSMGKTIYVDGDANGTNDGSSWENAYLYLTDALDEAEQNSEKPIKIRVAQGIYTPDMGANAIRYDRNSIFWLINGVTISGGYAGNGESDPDARDIELYETILSGDLYSNDVNITDPNVFFYEPSRAENCYHVVDASETDSNAVLEGFTIRSGNADYDYGWKSEGGGMYIYMGNPVIADCTFTLNTAYNGAAMYNEHSNPTITNCRFHNNNSRTSFNESGTAGIYNLNSSLILTGCLFIKNHGNRSGAMNNNYSNLVLTNCKFISNSTLLNKGGGKGGGLSNYESSSVLTDCTFEENTAIAGGGMDSTESHLTLIRCTFRGNSVTGDGGALRNITSDANIFDCIFIENRAEQTGGGIINVRCKTNITNCTIKNNRAYQGAGIENINCNSTLKNCIISGNCALSLGGGICNDSNDVTLQNCKITGNLSFSFASGILNLDCNLTLINCTIADNVCISPDGYAIAFNTWGETPANYAEFINCILWNGQHRTIANFFATIIINYSDIQQIGLGGMNNIQEDPCFAQPGYWVDIFDPNIVLEIPPDPNVIWISGDYHLKSEAGYWDPNSERWITDMVTSPCIDIGDPNSPVAYEPYPNGIIINMGAYGGTEQASKSPSGLHAKYGGGKGDPNDPYQIYTAEHLNTLGSNTSDYNKHFMLMADVNMAEYLYDSAVIAPGGYNLSGQFAGVPFTGVFDGNGHVISNLTIEGHHYLGLFGYLDGDAIVTNLGIEAVDINGVADYVAGFAAFNYGSIIGCYCTGVVDGNEYVGGLVGDNTIGSDITNCYSMTAINGNEYVGGIAGYTRGNVTTCYSTGKVTGEGPNIGGLIGENFPDYGIVTDCFWDTQTSGQSNSDGGTGKTTAEMKTKSTFTDVGWDFAGETENGDEDIWMINEGSDYPRLWWQ